MRQDKQFIFAFSFFLSMIPAISFGGTNSPNDDGGSDSKISITPMYGYNFAETFQTDFGSVYMNDGPYYGLSLGFKPSSWHEFEMSWYHQVPVSEATVYYYNNFNRLVSDYIEGDMALDYFLVGANGLKELNDRFTGFVGLSGGIIVFTPRDYNIESVVRFSVALKAGMKIKLTDHIGIRLQPQLFIPLQSLGAEVFVSNQGSGLGVSGYSTISQFGGNAGLTFSF